jgi:class 3 adenylate cyclase
MPRGGAGADMKEKTDTSYILHAVEIVYSLALLFWIFGPLIGVDGAMPSFSLPMKSFEGAARVGPAVLLWGILIYLPGLIALFKISAPFVGRRLPAVADPRRPLSACMSIVESTLVIAAIVGYVFEYARGASFFAASSPLIFALLALSLVYNAFFIYVFISALGNRDVAYQEYLGYKRSSSKKESLRELLLKQGIQKRLMFSFVPLILAIIIVLSFVLLTDFSRTLLSSVIDNGKLLAERTASVIKANPADKIAAEDFLLIEAKKNATAAFPFEAISYFSRNPKTNGFAVDASTSKSKLDGASSAKVEAFADPIYRYNADRQVYEFLAPVTLSKAFLGYVQVDYARDVIFEPYFRTQIKVIGFAAIFIYLSVFLIYLIGRNIVFPILYLRMSVASISSSLSGMIKGERRISAELLQFQDRVETNDEIKGLSNEVGNMTAVIRGIVPYISASTLKHSERERPMTESRDLCFLFTDIRGFTSLCEGMSPEKVVELLNRYLDLQSSIILANHGDIDKFVGDEVMAMFEGPDKELNAVRTSLAIRSAMAREKEKAIAAKMNVVSIGIGINSGPVVFGSVGAKDRMDFTSIGDTVNLAARLEGANKAYGTKTLVTESVYRPVKKEYLCREVDRLTVKGKKLPVSVYEIVHERANASPALVEFCEGFEEGLALYREQKWPKAAKQFSTLAAKYDDEASSTFLSRIELFKTNPPPAEWDGVFNMTVK